MQTEMDNTKMRGALARVARMWLGFAALMSAAGSASAAGNVIAAPGVSGGNTAWTVYAFGNAQAVSDALRSLTNFAASGTFQSIVSMVAVLGVLGVGLSGGFNPAMAKRFISYVVGVFLVCYCLFGVSNGGPLVVNIEVSDAVDNTWKAPVTVPAVVGIPAAMISTAGYELTRAIEASFPIPDALKMSNGAPFNLSGAMLNDATQAKITDPNLASSLAYYTQDCFTVGVAQGALQASTLVNSTNFLNDIHYANKAIMVNTLLQPPVGQPGIVNCDDAWTLINNAVNAQGTTATAFLKNASAWQSTPALSVIDAAADSVAQYATNNGITDGGAMVKQAAMLSAFKGSYSQAAAQTGNSEFLTNIAMAQAVESQRTSWIVGAEIFNRTMGYVFAIIQVFVYCITPLVLCAALVPGLGLALLKNFAQILLWLAIWQPMLSIVNFIVISMQQSDLGGALSSGAGGYGITLQNMGIITEKTSNLRAAASFVGTMTPALAWAMVKGSVDFSRVIGSAVGENFAAGAANTMTTGNYSLNNASMDSFTANKHSVAATGAWGFGQTTASATGASQNNWGGSELQTKEGQKLGVSETMQSGINDAGSKGSAAQHGIAGGSNSAASSSGAVSQGGTHQSGGGTSSQSGLTTGVNASADASVQARVAGGGGGGGGSGSGSVAPPGHDGDKQQSPPIQTGAKGPGRISANVGGRVGVSAQASQAEMQNWNQNDTTSTSATRTTTGSTGVTGSETGSATDNAQTNKGWSTSQTQSVQGWANEQTRSQMMQYANEGGSPNFLAIARDERAAHQPAATTPATQFMQRSESARGIQGQVDARKQDVDQTQTKLENTAHALKNKADGDAAKNMGAADGVRANEAGLADAAKGPAKTSAHEQFLNPITAEGKKIFQDTKDFANKAIAGAKSPEGQAALAAGAMGEFAGMVPGAGLSGLTDKPKADSSDAAAKTQAGNGGQPGPKAGANAGAQVPPGAAGAGGSPSTGNSLQQLADAKQQRPGDAKQQQPGDAKQQHPADSKQQHPDDSKQHPGDSKQQNRERENQQPSDSLAAPAPQQVPAPQAPQMPQPPVPQPEQPAPPTTPLPAPPAQDGQAQQQAGLPNVFDGQKKDEGATNSQNAAHVAEQRANQSETQRRNADSVLASTEGRKPHELPDLINQAREFTRNS
jgi:hypothetical protein